jgi:hypothetical protein
MLNTDSFPDDLAAIATQVQAAAQAREADELELLMLLRLLEELHRQIRDTLFQDALPDNRQALYTLLKDIEANGGWPYISRMKISVLLQHFLAESSES